MIRSQSCDPVDKSLLQGNPCALLLHHCDRHLPVDFVHLHGHVERTVSKEDTNVSPVAGHHLQAKLHHPLSPLPSEAPLAVVSERRVVGTEVDDRISLAGDHHEGRLNVGPEHGEGRTLHRIVAKDLQTGLVFLGVPELPVVGLLLYQVTLVGHPERLEVSTVKNAGHKGIVAQTFHLVGNKVTVSCCSSSSGRGPRQNYFTLGLLSEDALCVEILHYGRDDVPPVEVEIPSLLRGFLVSRVLIAAAVGHIHLYEAGKGGIFLRGQGEDDRLTLQGVWVLRGGAKELSGVA